MADDKNRIITKEKLVFGLGQAGKMAYKTGKVAVKVGVSAGKTAYSGAKYAGSTIHKKAEEIKEKRLEREELERSLEEQIDQLDMPAEEPIEEPEAEETEVEEEVAEEPVAEAESEVEEPAEETPDEATQDDTTEETPAESNTKKRNKKLLIIPAVIGALVLAAAGIYASTAKYDCFAKDVVVNGIEVGEMNAEQATEAMNKNLNDSLVSKDGDDAKKIHTSFIYENEGGMERLIRLSNIDPREKPEYKLKLNAVEGFELTATELKKAYPLGEKDVQTKNARIDYIKMEIVDAVQGTNIDYMLLAEDIAEQRCKQPTVNEFAFAKDDYIEVPAIVAEDLADELQFAKDELSKGMDIVKIDGSKVHIGPAALAKIKLYNGGNIEYSKEGAVEVARALSKDYKAEMVTVQTQEGKKTLYNYAITGAIDAEKTADSIVDAAENGGVGKIFADKNLTAELDDHVEVSLNSQTVYLVQNGQVTMKTPVVTGTAGHRTPPGIFKLAWKASPSVLCGKNDDGTEYENPVNFWMPFNGGIGLHDAPWRGSFGGSIYVYNGSHGCVNMPYNAARTVYNWIQSGDIIVVY